MLIQRKFISLLFIAIGFLLLTANVNAATLTASVDRTNITINDTLLLTITLDRQGADDIDFSALALQFDILQRQQNSQTSLVNGRITSLTQWTLAIAPKEMGKLIIPSLSANGAFSDAITIRVSDTNNSNNSNNSSAQSNNTSEVFLTANVNKPSVYVQEQVLLSLRLYYRISLSGFTPEEFSINNSTVELTAENNIKETVNGVTYNVLERIYALHPQASGSITIPAQRWRLEKPSNRFGITRSPYIHVDSQAQTIDVNTIPSNSTAEHWLPATSVTLNQQWLQSTISAKVGEPLSYRLTINADGLSHSQLPSIALDHLDSNAFTIYSDKAQTDNQVGNDGITGKRVLNYAVIPKTAGSYTLPPINLKWWNTATDKEETITLEPQRIIVANTSLDQQQAIPNIPQSTQNNTANDLDNVNNSNTQVSVWLWQLSTLLFIILSGVLCYLWLQEKRRNNEYELSPLEKGNNKSKRKNTKTRAINDIYKELEQAIEQQQWQTVKALVLEWASAKSQYAVNNSDEFINAFPDLAQAMQMLDKQLYSPAIVVWDFVELLGLLKQQQTPKTEKNVDTGLENLYR
ncbi:MAG: hypothetical protein ACJA2B_001084 [Candidatus Endobugula sp.]|jgi:hypothetical protein